MPNARLNERAPFFAEVDVLAAGTPAPRRVWGSDVSETGMFLQTTHPFRIGDRVSLRFDCADDAVHVRAAEVMWVRPFESVSVDGKMPGVGLKFVALDPPSRAALRKMVAPHLVDTTLPETPAHQLEGLPPPVASLPPLTSSILAMTTDPRERTDEMLSVSLPPFSQPPLCISVPPDESGALPAEVRVFRNTKPMGSPAPVTIGPRGSKPKDASMPPHPLAGWTFRRDDGIDGIDDGVDGSAPGDMERSDVTEVNASTLNLRFDDDAPGDLQRSRPPDQASLIDGGAFERSVFGSRGDFSSSPPATTQIPDEDAIVAIENAVMQGELAMRHLPISEERRASPSVRSRSRALPVALALLCAGTLVGVVVGSVAKDTQPASKLASAPAAATAAPSAATPAPLDVIAAQAPVEAARSVADAERELVPPAVAVKAAPIEEAAPVLTASTPAALPKKAASATTVKAANVAATASAKRTNTNEQRSIEVRVGNATVLKSFTLGAPSRVVVDIQGGQLPKAPLLPGDGISRVRFGTPAPGTSRVVVELDQSARATDVETAVKGGVLVIAFR